MKALLIAAMLLFSFRAEATLIDLNNGLVLDSAQNIYWTKNAGLIPSAVWQDVAAAANNFTLAGLSDYRLPTSLEFMNLYNELVGLGVCDPKPTFPTVGGPNCKGDRGPFVNITFEYWTSTIRGTLPNPGLAEFFNFTNGFALPENVGAVPIAGWAVHAVVPEVSAMWLLLNGIALIAAVRGYRHAKHLGPA